MLAKIIVTKNFRSDECFALSNSKPGGNLLSDRYLAGGRVGHSEGSKIQSCFPCQLNSRLLKHLATRGHVKEIAKESFVSTISGSARLFGIKYSVNCEVKVILRYMRPCINKINPAIPKSKKKKPKNPKTPPKLKQTTTNKNK